MISTRLQNRSPPMVIHTEDDQDLFQPVQCCNLFFIGTLSASFSKNDRINTLLPLIPSLRLCQENSIQKSHNLGFDFILQHIKKSNPRTSTPHLPFFFSFLTSLLSIFFFHSIILPFFSIFFDFFLSYHTPRS